ncbi:hypothetical protein PORCRE_479 [Porphyromonas crevioricanis JCM 15906]|uniref:Uncharacterized protein n=1 Tax=Porphyromonas crevioricanis JCM 15906 TaxID=1305617 RepID=T1CNV2_9PORP|nr:hypothetical protein PORCRE_479 [Porphyromonas crevioricanis JCM 15906]
MYLTFRYTKIDYSLVIRGDLCTSSKVAIRTWHFGDFAEYGNLEGIETEGEKGNTQSYTTKPKCRK